MPASGTVSLASSMSPSFISVRGVRVRPTHTDVAQTVLQGLCHMPHFYLDRCGIEGYVNGVKNRLGL